MKYVRIYSAPMRINLSFLLVLSLFFNCVNSPKEPEPITLIPKVKSLTVNDGVYMLNQTELHGKLRQTIRKLPLLD